MMAVLLGERSSFVCSGTLVAEALSEGACLSYNKQRATCTLLRQEREHVHARAGTCAMSCRSEVQALSRRNRSRKRVNHKSTARLLATECWQLYRTGERRDFG